MRGLTNWHLKRWTHRREVIDGLKPTRYDIYVFDALKRQQTREEYLDIFIVVDNQYSVAHHASPSREVHHSRESIPQNGFGNNYGVSKDLNVEAKRSTASERVTLPSRTS